MNKQGIVFAGMGFELVGLMLGSVYLGQAIDKHMGWSGISLAALMMLSLVGWIAHIMILLNREEKAAKERDDHNNA